LNATFPLPGKEQAKKSSHYFLYYLAVQNFTLFVDNLTHFVPPKKVLLLVYNLIISTQKNEFQKSHFCPDFSIS
jgi:hypothetical protein